MTRCDVIIRHFVTLSVKLHQEAPLREHLTSQHSLTYTVKRVKSEKQVSGVNDKLKVKSKYLVVLIH